MEDAERHCHQLQENNSHAASEKKRLSEEIGVLNSQLSESKTRASELRNKQRQIRDKFNEAIQEQQDLYKRSQNFYEASMRDLRKEKEKRLAESAKINNAVEKGFQKRQELMKCLQELRNQMEREHRLSNWLNSVFRQPFLTGCPRGGNHH